MLRRGRPLVEQPGQRRLRVGPAWGRGEVELELLLAGEADKLPVIGEPPAVDVAQLVEHGPAVVLNAGGHLEQLDQFLGRQAARKGLEHQPRHGRTGADPQIERGQFEESIRPPPSTSVCEDSRPGVLRGDQPGQGPCQFRFELRKKVD